MTTAAIQLHMMMRDRLDATADDIPVVSAARHTPGTVCLTLSPSFDLRVSISGTDDQLLALIAAMGSCLAECPEWVAA